MTKKNLFITQRVGGPARFDLNALLNHHAKVRDAVASIKMPEPDGDSWSIVALESFTFAFNSYKALSMVLPEHYYEAGSAILRQMWEVSLNLAWVAADPEPRAQDFLNFTVMEHRKFLSAGGKDMTEYDAATANYQKAFKFEDRRGRTKRYASFAALSIQERAESLGDPWSSEYQREYSLTSAQAHGSPGAVLQAMFLSFGDNPKARERERASIVAITSMQLLERSVRLMVDSELFFDVDAFHEEFRLAQECWRPEAAS